MRCRRPLRAAWNSGDPLGVLLESRHRRAWSEHMMRRRLLLLAGSIVPALLVALPLLVGVRTAAEALPTKLSDQEFWKLMSDFSEPDGRFRSDNLLSNELWLQYV